SFCAPTCSVEKGCSSDRACTSVSDVDGTQLQVCVPRTGPCGGDQGLGGGTSSSTSGGSAVCGSLHAPDSKACCATCDPGQDCQVNGCYAGWWCNTDTCKCQEPPADTSCGDGGTGGGGTGGGGTGGDGGTGDGGTG